MINVDTTAAIVGLGCGLAMIVLRLFAVERLKVKGAWEAMGMPRAFFHSDLFALRALFPTHPRLGRLDRLLLACYSVCWHCALFSLVYLVWRASSEQ